MKKLFLMVAFAAATLTASAQLWMGGEVGFNTNKVKDADDATVSFTLAPEVGYNLSDEFAVAVALNYNHTKYGDDKTNGFGINPYLRYNYARAGDVTFFVDGGLGYTFEKDEALSVEKKNNIFNIGFKPGMAYSICDRCGLVAHFGFLGYKHTKQEIGNAETKINDFGFNFSNNISFGVYVNL